VNNGIAGFPPVYRKHIGYDKSMAKIRHDQGCELRWMYHLMNVLEMFEITAGEVLAFRGWCGRCPKINFYGLLNSQTDLQFAALLTALEVVVCLGQPYISSAGRFPENIGVRYQFACAAGDAFAALFCLL
jgi:hypothetical protein